MVGITKALYELKGVNLFTSHFVIGCKECNLGFTKTHTEQIDSLHKWLWIDIERSILSTLIFYTLLT